MTYRVLTWDMDAGAYKPQVGLSKSTGLTLWEVRRALRELQNLGYSAGRNDPAIFIEREAPGQTATVERPD
jgi:hypothetical protein